MKGMINMTTALYMSKLKKLSKPKNIDNFLTRLGESTFKDNSLEIDISKYKSFLEKYKKNKKI